MESNDMSERQEGRPGRPSGGKLPLLGCGLLVAGAVSLLLLDLFTSVLSSQMPRCLRWIGRCGDGTSEGVIQIRKLYDSSVMYYATEHFDADGNLLAPQFPQSAPLTPAEVPCGRVPPRPELWRDHPTWQTLNFALTDPHKYAYQYDSSGEGESAQFTASAFGDLDCDGKFSTFVRFAAVREGQVVGSTSLYVENRLE